MNSSSVSTLTLGGGGLSPIMPQTQHHHHQQQQGSHIGSSTTITQTMNDSYADAPLLPPVLRLRGISTNITSGRNESVRHIHWDESVINNEGMGKKKSKVCCIYHAPREFGESSDDSSDDSSHDSSGDSGDDRDELSSKNKDGLPRLAHGSRALRKSNHSHQRNCCGDDIGDIKNRSTKGRDRSPNAYEKIPRPRNLRKKMVDT